MKIEEINYGDCLDLGFKRTELEDNVFIHQYGYNWFIFEKRITKQLYFSWDCCTRTVELVKCRKKNIYARLPIHNLLELKNMIDFFTKDND